MSKHGQQQGSPIHSKPSGPVAPACPEGMLAAYFTERELTELRKICRDSDSELGRRYLEAGLERAAGKPVIRPVDGMR